jgi:hypothetical protein
MTAITKLLIFLSMVILTVVSMWTTYVSLNDSIFPEPKIPVPMGQFGVWECSVLALGLAVAIGMMLFALKMAIIDGQKRLGLFGLLGLSMVGFISIMFNMDVLYRIADREFFLRYSTSQVKDSYVQYLVDVRTNLLTKRDALEKSVAAQSGELESEIKGLRQAPAGYGTRAREEEYRLTVLRSTTEVDLRAVEEALEAQKRADAILNEVQPETLAEVTALQDQLQVAVKDAAAAAGMPVPKPIRLENPLFAVFGNLLNWKTVGLKEFLFLFIAVFLDLGDIIGYSLVPNKKRSKHDGHDDFMYQNEGMPLALRGYGAGVMDVQTVSDPDVDEEIVREARALQPKVRKTGIRRIPWAK